MKKDKKLLYRMVFSYTMLFSLIFLIIVGALYTALSANNREQARLNHQVLVGQPLKQLDRFLSEMDDVAYKAMTSEMLIRKFTVLRRDDIPDNHFDYNILESIDTATVIAALNRRVSPMRRIIAYNDKGDFISSGAIVDSSKAGEVLAERNAKELIAEFRDGTREYIISHPQKDEWMEYFKGDYFTFTRPIMNPYSRDVVGIVEVQNNKTILEEYLKFPPDKALSVNVYDEQGSPVLISGGDDDVVVAAAVSDSYGWKIELLEQKGVMRAQQLNLLITVLLTWVILNLAVFVIIRLISMKIARPLTDLTASVEKIIPGAPQRVHANDSGIYEITALESSFNGMLERLTLSMNQEKQAFLLAMQAQMNPHFLYNVLSVINAVALEGKSAVIADICGNLSFILRYSSSYVDSTATIADELRFTAEYLDLMKARYDYMFAYTVQVESDLKSVTIPKLIIQPICENCFTHAFSNMEPPYSIAIQVERVADGLIIRVTDNGAGFKEESRLAIIERANNADYSDLTSMQIGGLGLISSVLRLKLLTGKQVRCDIRNMDSGGSCVEILILEASSK